MPCNRPHVPLVQKLRIQNTTDTHWLNLKIRISLSPDFATSYEHSADMLLAGGTLELQAPEMKVRGAALAELTERISGQLRLKITADGQPLFDGDYPVDILPYDYWNGASVLPEALAAFVTPNHPALPQILKRAAQILGDWTGNPSFDEYQSRSPSRVRAQMGAIYEAIAELRIVYCTVPASFEETGQRVRLADAVLSQKMGNCLDMTLLYAACLEAVGIHPLLVLVHGHAFAGAWLIEESFADGVNDDASLLTKRVADGISEISLVEATAMNAGKNMHFDDAEKAAEAHLQNTAEFSLFIDVKRARFSRIRPLPLRIATAGGFQITESETEFVRSADAPKKLSETLVLEEGKGVTAGKQQLWERKLLDLTLRNNLLNMRLTKSTIQFLHIDGPKLEDALAGGAEMQLLPKPADWDAPERSSALYERLHTADPMLELAAHELGQKRLRCYLSETELTANMTGLYRAARTAQEENGASTLFIALGFLKWFETPTSEAPRYAPILLLPVEIIRKSARVGYVIRNREEEAVINITLLEKLRQDWNITVNGLDTSPRDESGIDVAQVFNVIRRAIMAQPRWDVEEGAVLGLFSFNKFILWNDIHNNAEALLQNKTVASLVSGKLEWTVAPEPPRDLDTAFSPADIALPIATDSSQLEAIIASGEGKSFVLHGPPGTGKSQTITNIIANALFAGRKVLFVAAKKAALDVVENRLESIGVGPFCVELHSNKTKKSGIIEQLRRATVSARKAPPGGFAREAERLQALRTELNTTIHALHQKGPFGLSLYEAAGRWSGESADVADSLPIPPAALSRLTEGELQEWTDAVGELAVVARAVGNPMEHPLRETIPPAYSPTLKTDVAAALNPYAVQLQALSAATLAAEKILQVTGGALSPAKTALLVQLATIALALPEAPVSMLAAESPETDFTRLKAWTATGMQRDALRTTIRQHYNAGALDLPAGQLLADWNTAAEKWFLPKWLEQRKVVKALKPFAMGSIEKATVPQTLQQIFEYQAAAQKVEGNADALRLAGNLYWPDGGTEWPAIDAAANAILNFQKTAAQLVLPAAQRDWRNRFATAAGDSTGTFLATHQTALQHFVEVFSANKQAQTGVAALLHTPLPTVVEMDSWIADESEKVARWSGALDTLKDWCAWVAGTQKLTALGLSELPQNLSSNTVLPAQLEAAFRKSFYRAAAEYLLSQSPELAAFSVPLFEQKIQRFKEVSAAFEKLTREELYARLASRIPDFTQEASLSSEVGLLQKALRSNARGVSIRRLFDTIPTLLPRLMPCALMSPISVAQYFDADSPKFDLVIFDEASQMPTCEAVGAIARATSVIVVGDPKQMPPTSFFSTNNVDEDNLEAEDLESILDDCLALSMPSKHLLWHYRSKHESLIAFSNAMYYDNSLLTFPSPDDLATKVTAVQVPGYYDKGKTRQNRFEAEAIVAEIVRRLSNPVLAKRSLGVVTFSVVQQNLIEDLLLLEFQKSPDLERIALQAEEPLFIKNLENVQGDERDVILFSVCYGPDENGKVSLNFGPLNREGGWRRLNVAVTRARYEMKVFATLKSDQIDLSRTNAEGVAGLKAFLAFAEKGKSSLPAAAISQVPAGGLETAIAEAIRAKGYEVHMSVGCSGYRVDLAVVHPAKPAEYLLGIICDGQSYGAARTARDREIVQPGVLQSLGWKLHRVWSTAWWEAPENVMAGIVTAIETALEASVLAPKPEAESTVPAGEPVTIAEPEKAERLPVEMPVAEVPFNRAATPAAPQKNAAETVYQVTRLALVAPANANTDTFLEDRNRARIVKQMTEVLLTEAPINKELLYRRVLTAWNIGRAGTRVVAHLESLLSQTGALKRRRGARVFLWQPLQDPTTYTNYRLPANETDKRDAEDLPPEEVAACIAALLVQQLSMPRPDLVKETARIFGFARMGSKVEEAMEAGLEVGLAGRLLAEREGRIYLGG